MKKTSKNQKINYSGSEERKEELLQFCKDLSIEVSNLDILDIALTHRSYINENRSQKVEHNERIEFLGDAVLELIVSEHLYKQYADNPEGELTSYRAAVVKTDSLAETARELKYGNFLRMSKGEEATGGREKDYLLANTFEAVLGAVYLDKGIEYAREFAHRILIPKLDEIVEKRLDIDPKTKFQELAQSLFKVTPQYLLVNEEGPDHDKIFTMAVLINKKEFGRGSGASKQKAEENAAKEAILKVDKSYKIA